jgi:hypothetical protein
MEDEAFELAVASYHLTIATTQSLHRHRLLSPAEAEQCAAAIEKLAVFHFDRQGSTDAAENLARAQDFARRLREDAAPQTPGQAALGSAPHSE